MRPMQPNRNRNPMIFALALAVLALAGFPPLHAADLAITGTVNEEPHTLVAPEGSGIALALADEIRVSATDPTDLVSYSAEEIAKEAARADAAIAALRAEALPPAAAAFIGWSEDATFTAAEFKAGTSVTGDARGEIPASPGSISGRFAHLGLWLAGDAWDAIASVRLSSGGFGLNLFAAPEELAIDGVAGKYRRTVARQGHALLGGETLEWD